MHCYRPMSNSLMQGPYQVVDACIKVRRIGYIQGRCSNRNRLKSSVSAINCIGWSQLVYAKVNMHCYRPMSNSLMQGPYQGVDVCIKVRRIGYIQALFESEQVEIFSFSYKLHWMVLVGLCKSEHALLQTNVEQPNARTISSGRCMHKSAVHRIYTRALFESKQVKIFSFSYKLHWMVLVGLCKSEHALLQTNVQQPNARTISSGRCMHKSAAHRIYTRCSNRNRLKSSV